MKADQSFKLEMMQVVSFQIENCQAIERSQSISVYMRDVVVAHLQYLKGQMDIQEIRQTGRLILTVQQASIVHQIFSTQKYWNDWFWVYFQRNKKQTQSYSAAIYLCCTCDIYTNVLCSLQEKNLQM